MSQLQLQQNLFTDAGDYVAGMHKDSKHCRVYLAQKQEDSWWQRGYSFEQAVVYAGQWQEIDATDCYISANGFVWDKGAGRTLSAVDCINGFYVDFDRYKIDLYKNLSPVEFLGIILDENPWLPIPTVFLDSGNGCWAFWQFSRSLNLRAKNVDWLQQWQTQQDFLIRKLSQYGADPACSDAARVVRCANTVNSKTQRRAMAWETGERYLFGEIKKVFNAEYRKENPRQLVPDSTPRGKAKPKKQQISTLFTWHNLAYHRMQDLKKLAGLRGGKYTEHRRMASWVYHVEAAHFCRTEDSLRDEGTGFIQNHIHDPEKYLKSINCESTIKRFNDENALVASGMTRQEARDTLGREKSKYNLTTGYIVEALAITEEEQRKLATLIDKDEKQRRNTIAKRKKRREQGAMSRSDYENRAEQRKQEAKRLYKQLDSVRAVAKEMNLSVGVIHRYIHQ